MFQLSFLNIGVLFLTAVGLIPILIHLFAKKKPKVVYFSSLMFLKKNIKQQNRRINLKNLLLLLLRILVIVFTILAIARPTMKIPFMKKSTEHPRTAIAIIVDNSYSMDYVVDTQTELDKAKVITKQINAMLSENDITVLMSRDQSWNRMNANLRYGKIDEKQINRFAITTTPMKLKEVLREAEKKLIQSQLPNREIYLITDMQKEELPKHIQTPVYIIPTSKPIERSNVSCQNASIKQDLIQQISRKEVQFDVVNHSRIQQKDVVCELIIDGVTVTQTATDLEPNQKKSMVMSFEANQVGWHSGRVTVRNERLEDDNSSWFSFNYNPHPKVALLTDDASVPLVLQSVLQIYTGDKGQVDIVTAQTLSIEEIKKYQAVVVYNKTLDPALRHLLEGIQKSERGYLFISSPDMQKEWYPYLKETASIDVKQYYKDSKPYHISYQNPYQSITEILDLNLLRKSSLTDFWQCSTAGKTTVLLQTDQYPLAVENNHCVFWMYSPESKRNEFLYDASYPVFAYRCLQYISSTDITLPPMQVGNTLNCKNVIIQLPSNNEIQVNNQSFTFANPGIYNVKDQNGQVLSYAVNIDYLESDYQRMSPKANLNIHFPGERWPTEILTTRYGYEIWKYLLILAIVMIIAEMLIIKSEERNNPS